MKTLIISFLLAVFMLSFTSSMAQTVPVKTDTSIKVTVKLTDVNFKYLIDSFNSIKAQYLTLKSQVPPKGSPLTAWIFWLSIILGAIYELVVTIIPTVRNIKLLHMASNIINAIAKLFNGVGNAAKLQDGSVGTFKSVPTVIPPIIKA